MAERLNRRDFMKKSVVFGASALLGKRVLNLSTADSAEVAVVHGEDLSQTTRRAVELLGGMGKFVPKNSRVAILPNSQSKNPGAYTKPEIVRAVVRMCREAGAREVGCLSWLPEKYWEASGLGRAVAEEGAKLSIIDLKDERLFRPLPLPRGKALKEAKIMSQFFEYDVFLDLPITKDHAGNRFTGAMKNLMGLNFPTVNRFFHTGDFKTKPDDIEHLDQCIADLNLALAPTLCLVDATEFLTTNGPFGPGEIASPRKIVAGVDRVAVDSYCATLLGMRGEDIVMIKRGHEHGLGEIDLKKVRIREVEA
ncbi:MAG: DUF362 domain-containing protein [Acidobacteriota bacterium]